MNFTQLASFTPSTLVAASDASFIHNYRTMRGCVGGRVQSTFNSAISDFDFVKIAIFNNDYLKVPPVETFLIYYKSTLPGMSDEEKRCIGALFGNLFKFIFGYGETGRKQYKEFVVGSATYFVA
jgi:hypothetical protein